MGVSAAYGVEVYTYTDTITFYRAMGIIQYIGMIVVEMLPLSIWVMLELNHFALSTSFNVDTLNPNSSPSYLSLPVAYLPSDTLWQYNPLPFDPDGDSLAWSLTTPLGSGALVAGYQFLDDTVSLLKYVKPICFRFSYR